MYKTVVAYQQKLKHSILLSKISKKVKGDFNIQIQIIISVAKINKLPVKS